MFPTGPCGWVWLSRDISVRVCYLLSSVSPRSVSHPNIRLFLGLNGPLLGKVRIYGPDLLFVQTPESILDHLRWGHPGMVIGLAVTSDQDPEYPGVIWWWSGPWWWHCHWTIQTPGNIYIYFIFAFGSLLHDNYSPLSQGALQPAEIFKWTHNTGTGQVLRSGSVINPSIRLFRAFLSNSFLFLSLPRILGGVCISSRRLDPIKTNYPQLSFSQIPRMK